MPNHLTTTSPVGVLQHMTFLSFTESRIFPMQQSNYHDGAIERSLIVDGINPATSIKSWKMSARLTGSQMTALRTFYETTTAGSLRPFYFYSPFEPQPGHAIGTNWDSTGVSTYGRYKVRFANASFTYEGTVARFNVAFDLAETA